MTEIRTAAERAALPAGTVVLSSGGTIACRHVDLDGVLFGIAASFPWDRLQLPLTVLYRPDQPQRVQPTREDVARALFEWDIAPEHPLPHPLWDDPHSARLRELWLSAADTVLALFDAQPTEAEVRDESEGGAE